MKRTRNLKLPNGFGTIVYLGDKRRKPYGAMKTLGWTEKGTQIRKYVGYGKTWNEAYEELLKYNRMPFNIDNKNITVGEVYKLVEKELYRLLQEEKISNSSYTALISTWNCHLSKLKEKKILEIKKKEVQSIIDKSGLKYTGRNYIRILWTKIVNYCTDELELKLDTNIHELNIGEKEKSTTHTPFTNDEVRLVLDSAKFNDIAILVSIYFYTGLRPSELLDIKIENVFLEKNYMIGGSKTNAGKNRIIPIHSEIKNYIVELYKKNKKYLILDENKMKMNYDGYRHRFEKLMTSLNLKHKPHDTRHTFATKCNEVGISDVDIKILMGHSLAGDVTNDVYIHKTVERLRNEIERIKY